MGELPALARVACVGFSVPLLKNAGNPKTTAKTKTEILSG